MWIGVSYPWTMSLFPFSFVMTFVSFSRLLVLLYCVPDPLLGPLFHFDGYWYFCVLCQIRLIMYPVSLDVVFYFCDICCMDTVIIGIDFI